MRRNLPSVALLLIFCLAICCQGQGQEKTAPDSVASEKVAQGKAGSRPKVSLELETFNGGFFSIEKPKGWQVIPAGGLRHFRLLDP